MYFDIIVCCFTNSGTNVYKTLGKLFYIDLKNDLLRRFKTFRSKSNPIHVEIQKSWSWKTQGKKNSLNEKRTKGIS